MRSIPALANARTICRCAVSQSRNLRLREARNSSVTAGVVARALETDVHVIVVVGLVAHDAAGGAAAVRILEDPLEPALADPVVERPAVEQALDVEVEEDHLHAAVLVGRGEEALE